MKIIVDESVSFGVVGYLKAAGYDVTGIMENPTSGLEDKDVFELVVNNKAVLITRDHHFTNSLRFPASETSCIIYIRNCSYGNDYSQGKFCFGFSISDLRHN
ncbi:DUF5615 family PIN-like protein [candidate division KSB1 bacterium]|nr:DUF5615 family PIN-like protein [candidate division KSB1 bacterium]MBL7093937.1 DUF5615 family PIN-like protein [candidate division KSB1 bacterium]